MGIRESIEYERRWAENRKEMRYNRTVGSIGMGMRVERNGKTEAAKRKGANNKRKDEKRDRIQNIDITVARG